MEDTTQRFKGQSDIVDYDKLKLPIHIIGCGGIGSWTALMLAKMGCSNIHIYDFDKIEEHNVASQFFKESQLGEYKTDALVHNVYEQTGITLQPEDVDDEPKIDKGIVIFAVDSMEMRWKLNDIYKDKDLLIIDGRMGGLQAEVYCSMAKDYEPTLVAVGSADPEKCTAKSICFNCGGIASLIANFVRLYVNDALDLKEFRERTLLFETTTILRPKIKKD